MSDKLQLVAQLRSDTYIGPNGTSIRNSNCGFNDKLKLIGQEVKNE